MTKTEAIIAEARRWVGTPYRHHQMTRGVGVDAWHLIRAVGEACEVLTIDPEAWATFQGYPRPATAQLARSLADAFLIPIAAEEASAGDVCLLAMTPGDPAHMGLLTDFRGRRYLLHAYGGGEGRIYATGAVAAKVMEHGFIAPWPRRAEAWYRFPGLTEG